MADLARMADDPAAFGAEVRVGLADWQAHDVREAAAPGGIACWLWTRQGGKSRALGLLGLWQAFRRPGSVVLVVSGGGELGARRLLGEARRIAAGSPLLSASVVDESGSRLELDNGSVLVAVAAHEGAIRGWSADALLCDEAQLLDAGVLLGAALPTVAARPHAFTVLAGTAGRGAGPFFDIARRAELGAAGLVFSRRVSEHVGGSDRMPWQSASTMVALEQALGPVRADAELRGRWSTGADYLFSREQVDAITADYAVDALGSAVGPAACWVGLDFAVSAGGDHSAAVALGRLVGGERGGPVRLGVRVAREWPSGHPLVGGSGVLDELVASPVVMERISVDGTGVQSGFAQMLVPMLRRRAGVLGGGRPAPRVRLVHDWLEDDDVDRRRARARPVVVPTRVSAVPFTSQSKAGMFGALRVLVERAGLVVPASATALRSQLIDMKVSLGAGGAERFEHSPGGHDDLVDALVLSLSPYKGRDGRWRCRAVDVVESGRQPEEPPPGLFAGGSVATAGGVVLPAGPTWASPARSRAGLTVPDAVAGWRPPPDPRLAGVAARVRAALDQDQHEHEGE